MKKALSFKISTLGTIILAALSMMLVIIALFYVLTQTDMRTVRDAWTTFETSRTQKAYALNAVSRDIGYGGMIHAFKNYLLRGTPDLHAAALTHVHSAQAAVDSYSILALSADEASALKTVHKTLRAYESAINTAHALSTTSLTVVEIDARVRVDDTPALAALSLLRDTARIETNENKDDALPAKAQLLSRIRYELGFGGMIHTFKNYVIRGEEKLVDRINETLRRVDNHVAQYRRHSLSEQERVALDQLQSVAALYRKNLEIAVSARQQGETPQQVDARVRIDDTPALQAFTALARGASLDERVLRAEVNDTFESIEVLLRTQFLVELLLISGIVGIIAWLIRRRIVAPITELTTATRGLAAGNLTVTVPVADLNNEIGEMSRALEVFRADAIEQIRGKEDLRVAKEAAEAANKAKSEFLSSMSHELRTPMNAILGFGQLIAHDPDHPLTERQQQSVNQILIAGEHLLHLIDEVLELSDIEGHTSAQRLERLDPREAISRAINAVQTQAAQRDISIEAPLGDDGIPPVKADRSSLRRVLDNLLSNAVKYNRDGGSVTITCQTVQERFLRISVTDTGVGINDADKQYLFLPFHRLSHLAGAIEGAGIGLTIAQKLAESMEGELGFQSVEGEGSTFWIQLPLAGASFAT